MPPQGMLADPILRHVDDLAASGHPGAQEIATYYAGQSVGLIQSVQSTRDVIHRMASEYVDALKRINDTVE